MESILFSRFPHNFLMETFGLKNEKLMEVGSNRTPNNQLQPPSRGRDKSEHSRRFWLRCLDPLIKYYKKVYGNKTNALWPLSTIIPWRILIQRSWTCKGSSKRTYRLEEEAIKLLRSWGEVRISHAYLNTKRLQLVWREIAWFAIIIKLTW